MNVFDIIKNKIWSNFKGDYQMKNSKVLKFIVLFSSIAMFLLMLAGCQSGKSMIRLML